MDSLDNTAIEPEEAGNPEPVEAGPETAAETTETPDYHIVKVNGEELQVPYEELVNGYSRTADYTRKTQEVAAERERLQIAERLMVAFDRDPERTLRTLAETYGINLAGQAAQAPAEEEWVDPEEKRLQEIQSKVDSLQQTWEERQVEEYIEKQYTALETKFGEFDRDELAEYMLRTETRDFETAYKSMQFDRALQRAQSDRQARDAKTALPPVSGGHGVQAGVVTAGAGPVGSLAEAYALAKQEIFG